MSGNVVGDAEIEQATHEVVKLVLQALKDWLNGNASIVIQRTATAQGYENKINFEKLRA